MNSPPLSDQNTLIFNLDCFSSNALNSLNLSKHSLLALIGLSQIFLKKSSMKVTKYLHPPMDVVFIGPHTWITRPTAPMHELPLHAQMAIVVVCLLCNPHMWMKKDPHAIGVGPCRLPCHEVFSHYWCLNGRVDNAITATCRPLSSIAWTPPIHSYAPSKTWYGTSRRFLLWWPPCLDPVITQSFPYD